MTLFSFKSFPNLKSERLFLRKATLKDTQDVLFLRSNNEINKFVFTERIKNIEETKSFIALCDTLFKQKNRIFWLIEYQQKIIGSIILHQISLNESYAEIGYKLKPEFHQKGIMSEALNIVLEFSFNKMNLKTVEAFTHKNNSASIALLKKQHFNFQPERKDTNFENNRIYKIENIR
ncbi:ribosomal-protein-alanine N-acetyltransferase [Polaribacter sp. KT25b]|uniref:GNAT family N-acetyltransferase n=1 Tax=Polaribacter sp. KT25b TaxID=1855336 RepID=UPI00087D98AD|nr:GNAT family N-acetyltransferase [Polaribacter sp. KT25b]SDS16161.1 ribosomal-protein-alanine N-acetyltransferase [Polaribacter sp. KT25b]